MRSLHFDSRITRSVGVCIGLVAYLALDLRAASAAERQAFSIGDYFGIQTVTELSLSADGAMVAYAVAVQSLETNQSTRTVYISATAVGAKPVVIDTIQKARNFAWIPGTNELAFLLSDGEHSQVYSINTRNREIRQHTYSAGVVSKFRFGADGEALDRSNLWPD